MSASAAVLLPADAAGPRPLAVLVSSFRPVLPDLSFAAAARMAWHDRALCAETDPELFFPEAEEGAEATSVQADQARGVCRSCPVRAECLAHALGRPEMHGTWGGLSEQELSRERNRAPRRAAAEIIATDERQYARRMELLTAANDRRLAAERRRRAEAAALLRVAA